MADFVCKELDDNAEPEPETKAEPEPETKAEPEPEVSAEPQPELSSEPEKEPSSEVKIIEEKNYFVPWNCFIYIHIVFIAKS